MTEIMGQELQGPHTTRNTHFAKIVWKSCMPKFKVKTIILIEKKYREKLS